ncbi:hypothetical protein FRZ67_15565 [Panacibacter ginsenosidivorans]|uniref:Uncharacterized protein n=1 Tax=Panacibacter ginsenosidivorans TaxID=1813871 RepID=A0A5B8VDD2_9BACT|nr:hypothetical protein [Panacibacter ginsenosidivorans]QEC68656.1 hypothetical protein FRZ67_15565 [Panacibacter ginsenosidivorans]
MRNYALIALMLFCVSAKAQFKLPVVKAPNEISPVLEKVITDFPNDFSHIKGDLLEEQPSIINYACVLNMKGMQPGIISQYGYADEHAYSWKNVLLETNNFDEAKTKFKQFYNNIKKTEASIEKLEIKLAADYVEPEAFKTFNTIRFKLETMQDLVKDVTVELNMEYEMDEWKITVSVFHIEDAGNSLTNN